MEIKEIRKKISKFTRKTCSSVAVEGRLARTSIKRGDFKKGVSMKVGNGVRTYTWKARVKEPKIGCKRL